MKVVEYYEKGLWSEEKLFIWAVQGTLPVTDPSTNKPYTSQEKKNILLKRIEYRLGPKWVERWKNGFVKIEESIFNWQECGF